MSWHVQPGFTCCCNGQSHEIGGIQTTFFSDGSTCIGSPGGCANQSMQSNGASNMVPWNLVDPNSNSGYGQGAGTSFPGTGQLNGQTPIGIWSVNNTFSCTHGGNDFGEPYIWFTQQLYVNNDPLQGCIPNPANCSATTFTPNIIVNCCDPSEKYTLCTSWLRSYGLCNQVDIIINGNPAQAPLQFSGIGITNPTQAFRANFAYGQFTPSYTGYKCWTLQEEYPTTAPLAMFAGPGNILTPGMFMPDPPQKYPDCGHLNTALVSTGNNPCCTQAVPSECEPQVAKLTKLTSKLDEFTTRKNNIIGK